MILDNLLKNQFMVISVMGPHAGELENDIFNRKINDIDNIQKTFWLIRSNKAKPNMVQQLCSTAITKGMTPYCIFIKASTEKGAVATKTSAFAKSYSVDGSTWVPLPKELGPVTGKIDAFAYALVFDRLGLANSTIDLWDYADFFNQDSPIKIMQGASSICAIKKDMKMHTSKIKSRYRRILAVGKLSEPFCVYLRGY